MIKKLTLLLLVFLTNTLDTVAQNDTITGEKTGSSILDIEKVYLHTDKSYYTIGESLWYKAYLVYAYTNVLFDNSNLLYVELISPESKIIARNITRIDSGLGHGDMMLTDSIGVKPGTYQLRAYTNWMRNFGDDFFFKKDIEIIANNDIIIDEQKKNSALSFKPNDKNLNNIPIDKNENLINIQFFPEGGSLIENVASYVAFKATDKNGNPINVEGNIYDTNRNMITSLKSSHDGMGKFMIIPQKNQQYSAEITDPNGQKINSIIPKTEKTGYVLTVINKKGKNIVTIKTNPETLGQKPDAPLTLICSSRGITYFEDTQSLNENKLSFLLPEEDLPEGIAQITLFDGDSKPQCERLVYIEKDHAFNVTISPNKKQYAPREKVNFKISAKNKQDIPLVASFSMVSTDANLTDTSSDMNICSYFLMASDIKGKIHNPGYYFDLSKPDRLPHLDLLLLTQGWRDFLWKKQPVFKDSKSFELEKGIKISGKVRNLLSDTAKENSSVKMVLMNNGQSIFLTDTTDMNGNFEFNNIVFTGNATMMLNTQNEKEKNRGMFVLDPIYNQPTAINPKDNGIYPSEKIKLNKFKENIYNRNILFNIPNENILNDVVVTSKKEKKEISKFGFADHTYVAKEKGPNFATIFLLIQFSVPGVTVSGKSVRFNSSNGPALILIDGVEAEMEDLDFVIPDDVAKIESIKTARASVFGSKGANGALAIYTKEGSINSKKNKVFHSITKQITGFQNTRIFYSPDYNDPKTLTPEKTDIRNTLYWNPYIHPDENGNAEISYYNNDVSTEVKVILEGITNNGIPIVLKTNYNIQK